MFQFKKVAFLGMFASLALATEASARPVNPDIRPAPQPAYQEIVPWHVSTVATMRQGRRTVRFVAGDAERGTYLMLEELERGRIVSQTFFAEVMLGRSALSLLDVSEVELIGNGWKKGQVSFSIAAKGRRWACSLPRARGGVAPTVSCTRGGNWQVGPDDNDWDGWNVPPPPSIPQPQPLPPTPTPGTYVPPPPPAQPSITFQQAGAACDAAFFANDETQACVKIAMRAAVDPLATIRACDNTFFTDADTLACVKTIEFAVDNDGAARVAGCDTAQFGQAETLKCITTTQQARMPAAIIAACDSAMFAAESTNACLATVIGAPTQPLQLIKHCENSTMGDDARLKCIRDLK